MDIRDILIMIDATPRNAALLAFTCGLAARHDARVIGLR